MGAISTPRVNLLLGNGECSSSVLFSEGELIVSPHDPANDIIDHSDNVPPPPDYQDPSHHKTR